MTTLTAHYREVSEPLPTDSTLILRGISRAEYEELTEAVGEAPGLRISYDQGMMQIVTLSSEHESFARLIERLVDRLSSRAADQSAFLRLSPYEALAMLSEPDAHFYVQSAALVGNRVQLDFTN